MLFNQRFTSNQRLRKAAQFDEVFSKAKKLVSLFWVVYPLKNEEQHSRMGVVVSRKVDKRAVARNRLKRLARETFRLNSQKITPAFDFVVLARTAAVKQASAVLIKDLEKLLEKASSQE